MADGSDLIDATDESAAPRRFGALWQRFRADRGAVAGLVVVGLLIVVAVVAPLLAAIEGQDATTFHTGLLDPDYGAPTGHLGGVSGAHWLGVEPKSGRDVFARIVYGARISLMVALGATAVQVFLGLSMGLLAGLGGRLADSVLSRMFDVVLAFPSIVLSLALLGIVPASFPRPVLLMLVIGILGWGGTARLTRAQALSLKTRDYVAAARLAGTSSVRIAVREIAPGLAGPVITYAALLIPQNVIAEAALSFLGVGVRPPTPSWGQMLSSANNWFRNDPMYMLVPAALIFLTVLAFTLVGEGVRTAIDPRTTTLTRKAAAG